MSYNKIITKISKNKLYFLSKSFTNYKNTLVKIYPCLSDYDYYSQTLLFVLNSQSFEGGCVEKIDVDTY